MEEYCNKEHKQVSEKMCSTLIELSDEFGVPDDPKEAANHIMSIAYTGGMKYTLENPNL